MSNKVHTDNYSLNKMKIKTTGKKSIKRIDKTWELVKKGRLKSNKTLPYLLGVGGSVNTRIFGNFTGHSLVAGPFADNSFQHVYLKLLARSQPC